VTISSPISDRTHRVFLARCGYFGVGSDGFAGAVYGHVAGLDGGPAFGQDLDSALLVAQLKAGVNGLDFAKRGLGFPAKITGAGIFRAEVGV